MEFLYFLEKLRRPWLDTIMATVTELGGETVFLVLALVIFWCIDKRQGYYVLSVGFLGTIANQFLKLWFRVPRPWVLDPDFTILEQTRAGATGYSFPSGHTQNAVGTYGALAVTTDRRWVRILCLALAILVPFSRMYAGVHTPADVLVAAATAIFLLFVSRPVIYGKDGARMPVMLAVMACLALAFVLFVECYPFPGDIDALNLASGEKNAYTLLGALSGLIVVYAADRKRDFQTRAIWWAQILKVILGLCCVLAVKNGLKQPLNALFGGHSVAHTLRYFLVVLMAGLVWPATFPLFQRLGGNQH